MKVLLRGIETQFHEEYMTLIDAINAHTTSINSQTRLLEELCQGVQLMNENRKTLLACRASGEYRTGRCSHHKCFPCVRDNTDTVSQFISSLNERVEDIRLVVGDEVKAEDVRSFSF